jgi:calmodulin
LDSIWLEERLHYYNNYQSTIIMSADFKKLIKDKEGLQKIMESAFRSVDIDGSGFLEKPELEQVLIQVAKDIGVETPTKEDVEDILEEIDENGDERLSKQEFEELIKQIVEMMATSEDK